jgi:CMP-N-acetylneuraminic acid synthetase
MRIALIPARGGSKSIANKNLRRVGGKTMIDRAISWADQKGRFDRIIVSTDIDCIDPYGKIEVHKRADNLCSDSASMIDVLMDAIGYANESSNPWWWILQPTFPFRNGADFVRLEKLEGGKYNSIISVTDVGAAHPARTYSIKNSSLYPLRHTNFENKQNLFPVFIRSGGYYLVKQAEFIRKQSFYMKPCAAYPMPTLRSVNVDGPLDLFAANAVAAAEARRPGLLDLDTDEAIADAILGMCE